MRKASQRTNDSIQQLIIYMSKNIDPHIQKLYKIGELMGSGAYGHVWKIQNKENGRKYALKKVFGAFRNNVDAQRTYRQVEILKQLKHQNVIKLEKVIGSSNKQDLYLVFELMQADLLAVVGSNILSTNHQKYIIFQIFKAVSYLHDMQLLHRDLKPSNILLDSNCSVKICDFGLVRTLNAVEYDEQILSEEVATKWYRAPQLLLGSRSYSFPIDLWSIGCIIAELLTGKTLFAGSSTLEQLQKIIQYTGLVSPQDLQSLDSPVAECLISQIHPKIKQFTDYFSLVDPAFYPLLRGLLQFNPHKRLKAQQCLQLDLFSQFNSQVVQNKEIQKHVFLALNDNLRYNVKEYRNQIYSHILQNQKQKLVPGQNQSKKSLNKYKSLIKQARLDSQPKSNAFKVNKAKSASYDSKYFSKGVFKNDINFIRSSPSKENHKPLIPKSPSRGKNNNSPYFQSLKQIAEVLKNSTHLLPRRKQPERLKKVGKVVKFKTNLKK